MLANAVEEKSQSLQGRAFERRRQRRQPIGLQLGPKLGEQGGDLVDAATGLGVAGSNPRR